MKFHFISAHERVGPLRKTFGLEGGGNRTYPLASKLTSHEENIDVDTRPLRCYTEILLQHAKKGHALLKGTFIRPLQNESRTQMADKEALTRLLVLDIDGIRIKDFKRGKASAKDVQKATEKVIKMLPEELRNVSYVAVGSSSFGRTDELVSVHLHFILKYAVSHRIMKDWIKSLNYTQQDIYERLQLTPAKLAVKSIVDPCLSEASRIIYIAPPEFGKEESNPFVDNDNRISTVTKKKSMLDLKPILASMNLRSALVEERMKQKLSKLQKAVGIPASKHKYAKVCLDTRDTFVIRNPEQITMTIAYVNDKFVAYNVGAGDSNAYIVQRNNPEIVTCFKPDEPPFVFKEADPIAYADHIRKFGAKYSTIVPEEGKKPIKVSRIMFTDRNTDLCNTLTFNKDTNEIIEIVAQSPTTAADYMRYHGYAVPNPIPPIYVVCNPTENQTFYNEGEQKFINKFKPTKYMTTSKANPFPEARYGLAWQISIECPLIMEIVLHMLGDDMECLERFVNWFAFIYQTKQKTKTAWLLQGTQGTGKGLFYHAVIRPIFGVEYSKQALLQVIADDQFNGWMENCLFLMVDEFDMKATGSLKRTTAMLKNAITEPTMMIRHMQQTARDVVQRINFIMGSNAFGALAMEDRRRFNITPRQRRMLNARKRTAPLLKFGKDYDILIAKELETFCAFLRDFRVNQAIVSTVYESSARAEALQLGLNSAERFFENVQKGNFAAFIEILDKQDGSVLERDIPLLRRVKEFLRANLEHVNTNKNCYIQRDDLKTLYSYLAGKSIGDNAFGRMLNSNEFESKRTELPVGALKPLVSRPRCIKVRWTYEYQKVLDILKDNNVTLASVTPITQKVNESQKPIQKSEKETW